MQMQRKQPFIDYTYGGKFIKEGVRDPSMQSLRHSKQLRDYTSKIGRSSLKPRNGAPKLFYPQNFTATKIHGKCILIVDASYYAYNYAEGPRRQRRMIVASNHQKQNQIIRYTKSPKPIKSGALCEAEEMNTTNSTYMIDYCGKKDPFYHTSLLPRINK